MGPTRTTGVRVAAVASLMALSLLLTQLPASAGTKGHTKSSGEFVSTQWIEFGELSGIPGNVHVGDLFVDAATRSPYAFGNVLDYDCPPGERPNPGGHGEEPPPDDPCTLLTVRFLFGEPSQLTFSMDKKLTTATLSGRLTVSDHDGAANATPPVNITWTGSGATTTQSFSNTYDDGTTRYTFRYTSSSRSGTITGNIGAMDFTDDVDDESSGFMGSYRSMERFSSR